jgi:hypothetical protein
LINYLASVSDPAPTNAPSKKSPEPAPTIAPSKKSCNLRVVCVEPWERRTGATKKGRRKMKRRSN